MNSMLSFCRFAAAVILLDVFLSGCPSADSPSKYARPMFNLLDSVNSEADDIAPFIDDGALYFTSTRDGSEDIWRSAMRGNDMTAKFTSAAKDSGDFSALFSQSATNDGTIAFLTPNDGFFSSGHAFDTIFASRFQATVGGTMGGTDLFSFHRSNGKITVENLRDINSPFWDAHPAAAHREDTVLLIFASDRPDPLGASSPYKNQKALTAKGDTVEGNTDLFFAFRVKDKWTDPHNFMTIPGGVAVNSSKFEYSPFLYCIDQRPTLLFSSDRSGDMDIYQADLEVNFGKQLIVVKNCVPLALGRDSINMTNANDRFPFVPYPHGGNGSQPLYIASDRYAEPTPSVNGRMMKSFGGYDLYRFELPVQCRAPIVRYRVVVLDGEDNMRPIKNPIVELMQYAGGNIISSLESSQSPSLKNNVNERITSKNSANNSANNLSSSDIVSKESNIVRSTENPAIFNLEWGNKYMAVGGSLWDKIDCDPTQLTTGRTISHYVSFNFTPTDPTIIPRIEEVKREKFIGGAKTIKLDTTVSIDTLTCETLGAVSANKNRNIQSLTMSNGKILVAYSSISRHEEITGGRRVIEKVHETVYDTIPQSDTNFVRTTDRLVPTNLSKAGFFPSSIPANDTLITDTIIIYPRYYQYPLCEWIFTREFKDYRKNVPYFQTGFWEVNTSKNLSRHLEMLSGDGAYKTASFIELHPANQYFGTRIGMSANQHENRKARRERRKVEYRRFADTVDRNLRKMADVITNDILPSFLELDAKAPEQQSKLIIQIAAYSDARAISRGDYRGDERIEYLSGHYDEERKEITTKQIAIPPGESLVGANNDVLSKLRAWFGYKEMLALLRQNPQFEEMLKKGEIVLPQATSTVEFRKQCEHAKIILVIEGRQVDTERKAKVKSYAGEDNDYYSLDDVRRIDVQINRVQWQNGKYIAPPCCIGKAN